MTQATFDFPPYYKETTLDELEYERAMYAEEDCCDDDMEYYHACHNPEYEYNGYLGEDEDISDCTMRSECIHITDYPSSIFI